MAKYSKRMVKRKNDINDIKKMETLGVDEILERVKSPMCKYSFSNETEYEKFVFSYIEYVLNKIGLPGVTRKESQFQLKTEFKGIIDIIVIHVDGSISVFETKCTTEKHKSSAPMFQCQGIGQLLLYKTMLESKGAKNVRLFLVSNKIHYRTLMTFTQIKLPISLLEINQDEVFSPYLFL